MAERSMQGKPLTILLVEDDADHALLVMRTLEDHRTANKVYHVPDGESALDYAFRRGEYADPEKSPRPHLILLDLRLPRIGGIEVVKELKDSEELRQIPVVVLSSSESEKDIAESYNHHANSYVVKPVEFGTFAKLMDDLVFYWLAWNRHPWP